jgi:hypothetical protein
VPQIQIRLPLRCAATKPPLADGQLTAPQIARLTLPGQRYLIRIRTGDGSIPRVFRGLRRRRFLFPGASLTGIMT